MNRLDNVIVWLFVMGIVGVGIFISFYVAMFLLPIILVVVVGYGVYVLVKTWMLKRQFKNNSYLFENESKIKTKSKIIDAEFEILSEKKDK